MNQPEMLNWVHCRTSSRRSANLTALEQRLVVLDRLRREQFEISRTLEACFAHAQGLGDLAQGRLYISNFMGGSSRLRAIHQALATKYASPKIRTPLSTATKLSDKNAAQSHPNL